MNQFNDKGLKEGYWEDYYSNGNLSYKGNYNNDECVGYWEWYDYDDSELIHKEFHL